MILPDLWWWERMLGGRCWAGCWADREISGKLWGTTVNGMARQGAMAKTQIYLRSSENKTPVLIFLAVSCKCSAQIGPIDGDATSCSAFRFAPKLSVMGLWLPTKTRSTYSYITCNNGMNDFARAASLLEIIPPHPLLHRFTEYIELEAACG